MKQATTITATQMHLERGKIIKRCFKKKEHFIVEKDGVPLVVIIPIDEYRQCVARDESSNTL